MKEFLISTLLIILLSIVVAYFIFTNTKPVYDYSLEITPDSIYVIDEYDNIIHKEQVQWDNPTPLQQSLINNNQ